MMMTGQRLEEQCMGRRFVAQRLNGEMTATMDPIYIA